MTDAQRDDMQGDANHKLLMAAKAHRQGNAKLASEFARQARARYEAIGWEDRAEFCSQYILPY